MRVLIVGAGLLTLGLAHTPSLAAQESPPALTVAQAKRVVRGYDRANTRNNEALDIAGQAAIETVPIQTIDDASFLEYRGRGEQTLGEQAPLDRFRVHVPEQSGYPLQFIAAEQVGGDDSPLRQLLVFVRASEGEPWKVSMAAQLATEDFPKLPKDRNGFVRLLDADHAGDLKAQPDALAGALADEWARASGEERAKNLGFAPGPLTTGIVDAFISDLYDSGVRGNVDFTFEAASEYPAVGYRSADNHALCFFVLKVGEVITPLDSDGLVQPDTREVFGGLIEPGQYGQVRYDRLAVLAASVPPKSAKHERVDIIGIYDGVVSASAVAPGATTA